MTADEASQTISATLARLGVAETALGAVGATVARRAVSSVPSVPLPTLAIDDESGELRARSELGRGGMGVVHLAEQRSLARLVAVKTTYADDDAGRRALLREARTMGGLEHPNVVPVHALGVDAQGRPVLVMKRIEGVSWRALLGAHDHEAWTPLLAGHGDRMRANVEILSAVARALAFAHDRGVIHRDLKPDNVMIGRFGEVYLLDWGLALRMEERAVEPDAIVGTPGYLAPEMARGAASGMDERTDVYLLGATLFELLSGAMPHPGPTPVAALVSALLGEIPELPDTAPSDLADLVRHALSLDPALRPPSAEAFRSGLAAHLVSHETDILIERADGSVARATTAARAGAGSAVVLRALLEARFSLRAALDLRPGDPRALERLDRCTERMIEREIEQRNVLGARDLLRELARPVPRVEAAIAALERELAREREALDAARAARAAADISSAVPILAGLTAMVALPTIGLVFVPEVPIATPGALLTLISFFGVLIVLGIIAGRGRVLRTSGSRRVTAFLVVFALNQAPAALLGVLRGEPAFDEASALLIGAWVAAAGSVTVLPRFWPATIAHLLAAYGCVRWPADAGRIAAALIAATLLVVVYALRSRARELTDEAPPRV